MLQKDVYPIVSLIVVVRNEFVHIEGAIESLLQQTYPRSCTELILVDGMSTDGTREFLAEKTMELREAGRSVKLLDNPKKILAAGWNIAIQCSAGNVVCRIDAHSEIDPNYITTGIKNLLASKKENVVCVGGVLNNDGIGFLGKAISVLFSSRFGVGNSVFRVGIDEPIFTDTAVFGLYWKWIFNEIGYFDESLDRNQDIALHSKILGCGYKFVTHPAMKIRYYVRNSISKLFKKASGDGYWVVASGKSYLRHKIPLFFVLYLFSVPITFWILKSCIFSTLHFIYLLPLFLYLILSLYFGLKSGGYLNKLLLPLLFPAFHISYGIGSLVALTNKYILRKL